MARPKGHDLRTVPADTMRRYMEDFWRYFVRDREESNTLFRTKVTHLVPIGRAGNGKKGWKASFEAFGSHLPGEKFSPEGVDGLENESNAHSRRWEETFDKVVLACGVSPFRPSHEW